MSWVAAAVAVGTAGYKIYSGAHAKSKARKEAAKLSATRPKLQITPEQQDQLSLAESEFNNGLGAEATQAYNNATDRQFATSLDAILKSGGSANNIGSLYDSSEQGRQALAITTQNNRLNNIRNLMFAQNQMSDARNNQFKFNQWAPWADLSQATANLKVQGQQEIDSGISTAGQGVMAAFGGSNFNLGGNNFDVGNYGNMSSQSFNNIRPRTNTNVSPAASLGNNMPTSGSIRIGGY